MFVYRYFMNKNQGKNNVVASHLTYFSSGFSWRDPPGRQAVQHPPRLRGQSQTL